MALPSGRKFQHKLSMLYRLSYRTSMFERRAGIEPAVTIRCKQAFGPSLWQLRSLTAAFGKDGKCDSKHAPQLGLLLARSKNSLGPSFYFLCAKLPARCVNSWDRMKEISFFFDFSFFYPLITATGSSLVFTFTRSLSLAMTSSMSLYAPEASCISS